jgi:hypothetical protein
LKFPDIDELKPLFIDGNGGDGKNMMFRSMLTKYNGELNDGVLKGTESYVCNRDWAKRSAAIQPYAGMVQEIGAPLEMLYYLAYADTIGNMTSSRLLGTSEYPDTIKYPTLRNSYGKYWYRAILELKDSTPFRFNYKSFEHRYIYSLIVPDEKASAKFMQDVIKNDLKTYFGYNVTVEDRMMPYWSLTASEKAKNSLKTKTPGNKFKTTGVNDTLWKTNNAIMKDILIRMIFSFSFGNSAFGNTPLEEAPFIDETGINGEIDYDITAREFAEMLKSNWNTSLAFLHRLGLDLKKSERLTKVVVIRDPKQ